LRWIDATSGIRRWNIPERQIETSVALADPPFGELAP